MKQRTVWVVGCIALLCAIGFGISAQTKASDRERWEYKTELGMRGQGLFYNNLGNEGWELVAVTTENAGQSWYYFKRKK